MLRRAVGWVRPHPTALRHRLPVRAVGSGAPVAAADDAGAPQPQRAGWTRLHQLRARLKAEGRGHDAGDWRKWAMPPGSAHPIPAHATPTHTRGPTAPATAPLVDTLGRRHTYLRISLAERCNLRCVYCMPEAGVSLSPAPALLTSDEVVQVATLFHRMGVNKIRLTGGEPTLRRDLVSLVSRLRHEVGITTLGLTSNGVTLSNAVLTQLKEAGLTHINISLDTWDRDRFAAISRRPPSHHDRVLQAVTLAQGMGFTSVKVNVVVMAGVNDDELVRFVEFTRHAPVSVRFIELMPFAGNGWAPQKLCTMADQLRTITAAFPHAAPEDDVGAGGNETAIMWRVPGFAGRFGFIPTMSHAFCGTCNRVRLTADGNVKACLHGEAEVPLRDALRAGDMEAVITAIRTAVWGKAAALGGHNSAEAMLAATNASSARPMIKIGG